MMYARTCLGNLRINVDNLNAFIDPVFFYMTFSSDTQKK